MLHYEQIYLDEERAIYSYILDNDETRKGYIEFYRNIKEFEKSYKVLKKIEDDYWGGFIKLAFNLFKMNEENNLRNNGLIAWY